MHFVPRSTGRKSAAARRSPGGGARTAGVDDGTQENEVAYMMIYGKPAGAGTDVSLNNSTYPGTGVPFLPPLLVPLARGGSDTGSGRGLRGEESGDGVSVVEVGASAAGGEAKGEAKGEVGERGEVKTRDARQLSHANQSAQEGLAGITRTQVVTVTGLQPNLSYVFAVAAFTKDHKCIGGIGRTCTPINAASPLSLLVCWAYLARAARSAAQQALSSVGSDYDMTQATTEAANMLYGHFVEVLSPAVGLDQSNPLNSHHLREDALRRASLEEKLGFVHCTLTLVTYPCHGDPDIDQSGRSSDASDGGAGEGAAGAAGGHGSEKMAGEGQGAPKAAASGEGGEEASAPVDADLQVSLIPTQRERLLVVRRLMLAAQVAASIGELRLVLQACCLGHAHLVPLLLLRQTGAFLLPALVLFQQALRTVPTTFLDL